MERIAGRAANASWNHPKQWSTRGSFMLGWKRCFALAATTLDGYPCDDLVIRIKGMRYAANELVEAMTRMKQLIDQVPQADRARVISVLAARFADPNNADTIRLV